MPGKQIVDSFGRVHTNLRISVTDRCNIRCFYCMPDENIRFLPQSQVMSFEEITRFTQVCASRGVNKLRITGGEPLVRRQLDELVRMLVNIPGIEDVALTTNGVLLDEHAAALKKAGLHRLNISLDTLSEEIFQRISRRKGLDRVLRGIDAAIEAGFRKIRLNAIAMSGLTEHEVIPLVKFARDKSLEIRFIEFMPLDAEENWQPSQVLTGQIIRSQIEEEWGKLEKVNGVDPSQPSTDYQFADGSGRVGFINPVSEPFCGACNRLRITAEGKVRNCLFSTEEFDALNILRSGGSDNDLANLVTNCVAAKRAAHGIDTDEFRRPEKAMYQIGG